MGRWTGPQDPWFGGVTEALDETVGEAVSGWIDGYRDRLYADKMAKISARNAGDRTAVFEATQTARPKRSRWRAIDEPRPMDRGAMTRRYNERHGGHTGSDGVTTQRSGGWRSILFGDR